jgi:phage terminase large subunit GpA-like protein
MFIDVHDKLLFYCVCAWEENFTGYVIDYGTFPSQSVPMFAMASVTQTLGRMFPGVGPDGAIQAGLEKLVATYLSRDFSRGAGLCRIDRLLVDSGYKPGIVSSVRHKVGGTAMMLCKGLGIRAGRKPMSSYQKRPGEKHGWFWMIPNVRRTGEFSHVATDVNYWKAMVHRNLATAPGEPGSLTIFGQAREHELFAQHVANSEFWVDVTGLGRTVREWSLKPSKPDNHWLDCLVGCAAAASMLGCRTPAESAGRNRTVAAPGKRRLKSLADMARP